MSRTKVTWSHGTELVGVLGVARGVADWVTAIGVAITSDVGEAFAGSVASLPGVPRGEIMVVLNASRVFAAEVRI